MKKIFFLGAIVCLVCCKKTETVSQSQNPQKETVYVEKPSPEANPVLPTETENEEDAMPTPDQEKPEENNRLKNLSGKHSLTLQWISWDRPGTVNFKKTGENTYYISGIQRKGKDFLKIEGKMTQISAKELSFEGTVETYIENNGGECLRTGPQVFLVTQGRKYWRMQNMVHCFGLTDYVDIYF